MALVTGMQLQFMRQAEGVGVIDRPCDATLAYTFIISEELAEVGVVRRRSLR